MCDDVEWKTRAHKREPRSLYMVHLHSRGTFGKYSYFDTIKVLSRNCKFTYVHIEIALNHSQIADCVAALEKCIIICSI